MPRLALVLALSACTPKASFDPVADAGRDQLIAQGAIVALDGSGSVDPDGEVVGWTWSLLAAPEGSEAALEDPFSEVTSFLPDLTGTYTFGLRVEDDDGNTSGMDVLNVEVRPQNLPPVAELVADGEPLPGAPLRLDGRGSYDPEGAELGYTWELVLAPEGASPDLLPEDPPSTALYVPEVEGLYIIGLTVSDGELSSARADLSFSVSAGGGNLPPVAVCDGPTLVAVGDLVTVSGAASSDPEGDTLRFGWVMRVPAESSATLDVIDAPEVRFTADVVGDYILDLVVQDGELSDTCRLVVTADEVGGNNPPRADAGPDVSGATGLPLTLDGSGSSDPDGDPLTWRWTLTSTPAGSALTDADLVGADTATVSLTPDVDGDYELALEVCDAELCDQDEAIATGLPSSGNTPPVANAGADQSVLLGGTVTMSGSGSDPDGDPITYRWSFVAQPSGSALVDGDINGRYRPRPDWTPDVEGTYTLQLRVSDGIEDSYDEVDVVVAGSGTNSPPVANAGADQSVALGVTVSMSGGGSDPDGDPITYQWSFVALPSASGLTDADLSGRYRPRPTWTPDVAGTYTLQLAVSDGLQTATDEVDVVVTGGSANTAPVADAGPDASACALAEVGLDGQGSFDADGDALTYAWTFSGLPSGSALTDADIVDADTPTPTFTPDVSGTYTLTLVVDDGQASDSDSVDLTFDALDAVLVLHGDEGSGLTWTDSGPNGLDATLSNGDWTGGPFFGALAFDGEQAVVPYDTALDLSNDWTIEWWMRADDTSASTSQVVFMRGTRYTYAVWRSGSQYIFYGLLRNGQYAYLYLTSPALDGDWHHYAITMSSANVLTFYEDGVAEATTTARQPLGTSTDDLTIGAYPQFASTYAFSGAIDELIIRDVALSATEVADRFAATAQFCTDLSDADAPTAAITSPANNSSTDLGFVAVEGSAADDSALVSVTVDGVEAWPTSENFATWVAYVPVSGGSNTLTVEAEDFAGNVGTNLASVTVTYADDCYDAYELALTFDEDEGAGATDEGPWGLSATESGTDRAVGVFGNAASFDGGALATVPHDAAISFSGAFSLDLWFARDGASSDYEVLAGKGSLTGFNYAALITGSDVACAVLESSGALTTAIASNVTDGAFHHLACVYDGSALRIYVDGALEDSAAVATALVPNTDDLSIGGAGALYAFTGWLDNLRLHGVDLTAAEVADLAAESEPCAVSGNLALAGTATATRSASTNYDGSNVIDGSTAEDDYSDQTYWLLPANTQGSVVLDLGQLVGVTRVRWVNTHNGPRYTYATDGYDIRVSPTGDFQGEETIIDSGNGALETTLRYHQIDLGTPVPGRYIRFTVSSFHSLGGGINELEVYGL